MKRFGSIALLALPVLAAAGCGLTGSGPQTSQERTISGVHAVTLQTSGDLDIRIGDTESLTVTAGADAIGRLTSEVSDGTLVLGSDPGPGSAGPIRYTLTIRGLDRIELTGSGGATGARVLSGDATLTVSGSGSATITDLDLTSLTADLSGSGAATVSGTSTTSDVQVSGSGDYDAAALTTARTQVDISGSGQARVNATDELIASVSGSGDVVYSGNPAQVQRSTSGSGDVVAG